jgi:tRNA modification GTPase
MPFFDSIVAPITATGGAVGIVRISGPEAWSIAARAFSNFPEEPKGYRAYRGTFANGDDGILLLFEEGKSFTGEQSAEFQMHGSSVSITTLVELLISLGARLARPGEFTERAFLNGGMDLTQAEAVNDTVRAATRKQLASANASRIGALTEEISEIEGLIISQLAGIEASVDFSEEIGDIDPAIAIDALTKCRQKLDSLITRGKRGRFVREGVRIAIIGPPNAGKSSLLNALLGMQRAIVTPVAGTTRDYVEEACEIGGLKCILIDTAGLRHSADMIESLGIQRSRAQAADADLIWYVVDSTVGLVDTDHDEIDQFEAPVWLILNKIDLLNSSSNESKDLEFPLSAVTNQGLNLLSSAVARLAVDTSGAIPNRRHTQHLQAASDSLSCALDGFNMEHPTDLVVTHLRVALFELGLISGSTASQDLLDRIFSEFCIGK